MLVTVFIKLNYC